MRMGGHVLNVSTSRSYVKQSSLTQDLYKVIILILLPHAVVKQQIDTIGQSAPVANFKSNLLKFFLTKGCQIGI